MRLRVPPFLPPYAVLFLAVAYAIGSLWLSLARLDTIAQLTESAARKATTMHDLQGLLNAINDIETAGRGFALSADEAYLEPFERGRRRVPVLLSALRDKMRDDAAELALIEELVPLIGERTMITAAGIERKRSAPDQQYEMAFGQRGKDSSEAIRSIVAALESREQDQLAHARQTLVLAMGEARRDLFAMAGVTLLLVIFLFMAVRRLRSFIPVAPGARSEGAVRLAPDASPAAADAGVGTLLRDAILRTRLAAAAAPAESGEREHLLSAIAAMEQTWAEHGRSATERNLEPREERSIAQAIALLGQTYSRPDGLAIKATIDQSVQVADAQKAFLIIRSAEWAFEAIMVRKHTGDVTLQFTASGDDAFLRIHALTDNPRRPVTLTPKESEEANALQQGIAALSGTFVVGEGPTGFSLTVNLPVDS